MCVRVCVCFSCDGVYDQGPRSDGWWKRTTDLSDGRPLPVMAVKCDTRAEQEMGE